MNELEKMLSFEGNNISFKNEGGVVYVNANEMAKPFSKSPSKWFELESTKSYILELQNIRNGGSLIETTQGRNGGTWLHEDLAIEFARWISPRFAIWCNDTIKQLITKELQPNLSMLSRLDIAKMLVQSEEDRIVAEKRLQQAKEQLQLDAPKVLFANSVSESKDTVLIKELAGFLKQNGIDIGQNRLFEWLRANGYLCSRGESYNLPTQKAMDLKIFEVKKTVINKPNGTILTSNTTMVTGKGLNYFINKFLATTTDITIIELLK